MSQSFSDLSISSQQKVGGCVEWGAFVDSTLRTALIRNVPTSILLGDMVGSELLLGGDLTTVWQKIRHVECHDEVVVIAIVRSLLSSIQTSHYQCGNSRWSVYQCVGSSNPVLCVNCSRINPCNSSTPARDLSFTVSCTDVTTNPIGHLTLLWLDFRDLSVAPRIVGKTGVSDRTNITIRTILDGAGSIVCGLSDSSDSPSSSEMLILQGTPVIGKPVSSTSSYLLNYPNAVEAEYTVPDLTPASSYSVYCATLSPTLVAMSRLQMIRTRTQITTKCCRIIEVTLHQSVFDDSSDVPFAVTVSIGDAVTSWTDLNLKLHVSVSPSNLLNNTSIYSLSNVFLPSDMIFTSKSTSSVSLAYLHNELHSRHLSGRHTINVTLNGSSGSVFEVRYPYGSEFIVQSVDDPVRGPLMRNVSFSSDGSKIVIEFDSSTNEGGRLKYDRRCSNYFRVWSSSSPSIPDSFVSASSLSNSACVWSSDKAIEITRVSDINVGDLLELRSEVLKAKCLSSRGDCSHWPYSVSHNMTISAPLKPQTPVIVALMPSELGSCDDLLLDLSSSSGSGGRSWKSIDLKVSVSPSSLVSNPNITFLQRHLAAISTTSSVNSVLASPIVIPYPLFTGGCTYTLEVKLCNFLSTCGMTLKSFTISLSSSVPVSYLRSQSTVTMYRRNTLLITGGGYVSLCGDDGSNSKSTSFLQYKWSVYHKKILQTSESLQSISVNPMQFKLPAYSLMSGRLYVVKLEVKHSMSLKSSSVTVDVNVKSGDLVCVFSTLIVPSSETLSMLVGSVLRLRVDESLVLDWSGSYDEDSDSLMIDSSWSCVKLSPYYWPDCNNTLRIASNLSTQLKVSGVNSSSLTVGDKYSLRWRGRSSVVGDDRHCDRSFDIEILSSNSPRIRLSVEGPTLRTGSDHIKINPTSKLKVIGSIQLNTPGAAMWTVDDPLFDLTSMSLSPVSWQVNPNSASPLSPQLVSLVIPGTSLSQLLDLSQSPSLSFQLTLRCSLLSGYSSTASLQIETNSPPSICVLHITPSDGLMLDTVFAMATVGCIDVDLPIFYQYGYLPSYSSSPSGSEHMVVFRSRMELSYTSTTLPSGSPDSNYSLSCAVRVFDSLDCFSSYTSNVRVSEKNISLTDVHDYVLRGLNESQSAQNVDDMKNLISSSAGVLNMVNCSLVPSSYCTLLNRMNCGLVAGTCGECISGYVGVHGTSNTPCVPLSVISNDRRLLSVGNLSKNVECSSDDDCVHVGVFLQCSNNTGRCQSIQQSCPNSCSGHGECTFVSKYDPNVTLLECSVLDTSCVGRCRCISGYVGLSCSMLEDEYSLSQSVRGLLLGSVSEVMSLDNPDRTNVISWITALVSFTTEYSALNEESKILLSRLCETVLIRCLELSLSFEELNGLDRVIDMIMSISDDSRGRVGSDGRVNSVVLSSIMGLYSELLISDMVEGQTALQVITPLFRSSTFYLSPLTKASNETSFLKLSPPLTELESLRLAISDSVNGSNGVRVQSISFPPNTLYPVRFSITDIQPQSFVSDSARNTSVLSSLFGGVLYGNSLCENAGIDDECVLSVELVNYAAYMPIANSSRDVDKDQHFEVNCTSKVVEDHWFTCPRGDDLLIRCDGEFEGTGRRRCPLYTPSAICSSMSVSSGHRSQLDLSCYLHSYTSETTLCHCVLRDLTTISRHLTSTDAAGSNGEDDSSVQFSLQSVSKSVVTEFVSTWRSSSTLSSGDVARSWVVLLTVGSVGLSFLLIGAMTVHWDNREKFERSKSSSIKRVNSNLMRRVTTRTTRVAGQLGTGRVVKNHDDPGRMLETSLPSIYKSNTLWNKFKHELKVYHRWFGIIFFYSPEFPRYLRLLSLFSSVLMMLFIQSVTYDIADPDDGSCESCETNPCCLSLKSSLNMNEDRCYWSSANDGRWNITNETDYNSYGSCHFRSISGDLKRVFIVALFAAVLSAPLSLVVQFIITFFLSPETLGSDDSTRGSRKLSKGPSRNKVRPDDAAQLTECCGNSLIDDFNNLLVDLSNYQNVQTGSSYQEFSGSIFHFHLSYLYRCLGIVCDEKRPGSCPHHCNITEISSLTTIVSSDNSRYCT